MADYIASLMPKSPPSAAAAAHAGPDRKPGMFTGACGGCHDADAPMTRNGAPSLALSTAVNAPTPRGVIQVILHGIPWRDGKPTPYMPSFASALTDAQVADLAALSSRRPTATSQPGPTFRPKSPRLRGTS